jgi:hypothetical protein
MQHPIWHGMARQVNWRALGRCDGCPSRADCRASAQDAEHWIRCRCGDHAAVIITDHWGDKEAICKDLWTKP